MPLSLPLAFTDAMPLWAWVGFFGFIALMLALDLGVFQRESHAIKMKEALLWCGVWVALALGFNAIVWAWRGAELGQQFLASYLIELSLSVDNVFVFILVFAYFKVPAKWQHRVLFWGIIGAVVMRAVFILVGVSMIQRFHWVLYVFGAFLVYTGIKMALPSKEEVNVDPDHNPVVRLFKRFYPVAARNEEGHFFVRHEGRLMATPLFIVLLVVETTDVVFALDSIPAVLAITKDGFVALTSNIFAILGLRSLYFALSGIMQLFRYLKIGLAVILCFIGVKMLIEHWVNIPTSASLAVIACVLTMSVLLSVLIRPAGSRSAQH
ncbi:TerC family protein [Opitutus terrae]|uniref:Integral membrane protein TerC n=1 Tax=Opitutus terrae (strain DSM 11246 / JCM 15787 / PB90-1) TaxID=452637 RepID=B1ZWT4_OPITP|nr:TerC family protein [Opitutus terrae]ACB74211.1 Integral membrane protein TerC [Opitutus terrae PB90-1]